MQPGAAPQKPMHGEHVKMGDQVVSQQQMFGQSPGQVKVHGIEAGHYNPDVIASLNRMKAAGLTPAQIRDGIHNLLHNRPIGPAFASNPAAAKEVAAISRLMFVVEPARSSTAFATSFMAWE